MTSPKRRRSAREARRRRAAAEQLARRIGIPLRCGGAFTSSKLPDAQAMQGSVTSLYTALLCGANFVLHAAGWLEAALTIGYEKLVLDADHLGAVHTLPGGLPLDANALAMDAFREVDPGGHFFGCSHTLSNYETAFHECEIADTDSYENWSDAESKDSMTRANAKWKETLPAYQAPTLDPAIDEALREFMARKKASTPDIWHLGGHPRTAPFARLLIGEPTIVESARISTLVMARLTETRLR